MDPYLREVAKEHIAELHRQAARYRLARLTTTRRVRRVQASIAAAAHAPAPNKRSAAHRVLKLGR